MPVEHIKNQLCDDMRTGPAQANPQTTFMICPSDYKQKLQVEARKAKIQQMYEFYPFWPRLEVQLFMITGAYYESSLL